MKICFKREFYTVLFSQIKFLMAWEMFLIYISSLYTEQTIYYLDLLLDG